MRDDDGGPVAGYGSTRQKKKLNIAIVGSGNVATVLARAIAAREDLHLLQVIGRNKTSGESLALQTGATYTSSLSALDPKVGLCIICVSDDAVAVVAQQVTAHRSIIYVHTSGSVSSNVLARFPSHGVFYPLQTLSKDRDMAWSDIPVFVTGSDNHVSAGLAALASKLGSACQKITDDQRQVLHLAAVIANNFSTALFSLATTIMQRSGLEPSNLSPLIIEGATKVRDIGALAAQTGPAVRGDQKTIDRHLALLAHDPQLERLYLELTTLIKRMHSSNLA